MVVTDLFPPMNAMGVHRSLALCRHLVETGWQVTVLTGRDPPPGCGLDEGLVARIPPAARVIRAASPDALRAVVHAVKGKGRMGGSAVDRGATAASPPPHQPSPSRWRRATDWASWWLHVPDMRTGWLFPALGAGLREARRRRPAVIFSSAPAWTSHLVGAALSWLLDVPLVADFRDPWCGSAWHQVPYAAHRRVDEWLERAVVRRAARITCAWDGIRRHLAERHPGRADRIQTVLNGFDPQEIERASQERLDDHRCVLIHNGSFYGPRSPLPLFNALRRLQADAPSEAEQVLVFLVGLPTYRRVSLAALAKEHGVEARVRVIPSVPHQRAMAMLKGAHVALLFGQSGHGSLASVPAKVYEYVGARKPVLAVGAGTEACEIIRRAGHPLWAVDEQDVGGLADALREIVAAYRQNRLAVPVPSRQAPCLTWHRTAESIAAVLAAAIGIRAAGDPQPHASPSWHRQGRPPAGTETSGQGADGAY